MAKRTYAISWQEDDGSVFAGKLELGLTHVRLEGRSRAGNEVLRVFHYGDVAGISSERRNGDREIGITWYGRRITLTVIDGAGAFAEVLEELRHRAESPHAESGAPPMRLVE
jgi:hypothetical protein